MSTAKNTKKAVGTVRKKLTHVVAKKKPGPTNAQQAIAELYPNERSPYAAIPANAQGPGRRTGGHLVTLQAWSVNLQVTALLGENGGKLTGGYAQWDSIPIPRAAPISVWTGRALFTMDLELMFDGWGSARGLRKNTLQSVEPQLAKLEAMAARLPAALTPPALRIYGAVPQTGLKWVITGIDYGDALRLFDTGERARQELTVHLSEFRDETVLQNLKGAAKAQPPRKYKIKKGDTLKSIATRLLGKAAAWEQIVKLNPHFKPPLRGWKLTAAHVGKTLLVPAQTKTAGRAPGKPKPKGGTLTGKARNP
jgi:LysM repeat protein